jgi:mercuric ion transport protein
MMDRTQPAPERQPAHDAGALLLAAGGLAAAFGAASCCALPILLGSLGIGGAWLATVAWFAAPHRIALLIAAVICLAAGGGVFLWRRRAALRIEGTVCAHPANTVLVVSFLSVGAMLAVLGYLYA